MENLCYSSSNLHSISSILFLFFLFYFCISKCNSSSSIEGNAMIAPNKRFPALFIFGDSLADTGNNNYILTIAKANLYPYGIDFPQGPTGRFTNGKTTLDVFAELNNMPYPPPYLAPSTKGVALLTGVNYASSAAGILQLTGFNYLGRVPMDTQLEWFSNNIEEIQQTIGVDATIQLLAQSIFFVVIGSNDYINNYYLKISGTKQRFTPLQFKEILIAKFRSQLTKLYHLGTRRIVVSNLAPLGCIPSLKASQGSINGECSAEVNYAITLYNQGLKVALHELNAELPGSKFILIDLFPSVLDFHDHPTKHGFKVGGVACCGVGKFKGQVPCLPIFRPCNNRDDYVFFDAFHPTEKVTTIIARQANDEINKYFWDGEP